MFRISEQIKYKDLEKYKELKNAFKPKKEIKLGDKPENLMKSDSHKRIGRRIRQTGWR